MSTFKDSRLSKQDAAIQLSYELSHRIHAAASYPIRTANGSSIILYGHSYGVRIVWRGGKPLSKRDTTVEKRKQWSGSSKVGKNASKANEQNHHASEQASSSSSDAEYDSDEDDVDPSGYFPSIVHHENLTLGTEVVHIAVPDFRFISKSTIRSTPPIFRQKIVFAVACVDQTVRTIAVPLEPLSSPDPSQWGEEMAVMGGTAGHQAVPAGLSMTWTTSNSERDEDPSQATTKKKTFIEDMENKDWELIIASHSPELSGVILFARLQIESNKGTSRIPTDSVIPFQTLHLRSPACRIAFNPVAYPHPKHTHLLVAEIRGPTRVYDLFSNTKSLSPTASGRQAARKQGSWLATFLPSYDIPSVIDGTSNSRHRYMLDAQWTSSGRHIVGLVADGEWGIWDFDRLLLKQQQQQQQNQQQQKQQKQSRRPLHTTTPPIHFAVRGFVGISTPSTVSTAGTGTGSNRAAINSKTLPSRTASLAPMTPNTRREKGGRVFGSNEDEETGGGGGFGLSSLHSSKTTALPPQGQISIRRTYPQNSESGSGHGSGSSAVETSGSTNSNINTSGTASTSTTSSSSSSSTSGRIDDSILISYGAEVYSIGSLHAFWQRSMSSASRRGDGGSLYGPALARLGGLDVGRERITSVTQLGRPARPFFAGDGKGAKSERVGGEGELDDGIVSEVLVSAEQRIVFYANPVLQHVGGGAGAGVGAGAGRVARDDSMHDGSTNMRFSALDEDSMDVDRHLLTRGQLDLNGLDRMLDSMADGSPASGPVAVNSRRVGFAA